MQKRHLIELIIGQWERTVRQKYAITYCEIIIFCYREFMVRWGNSLSMTIPLFKWGQARRAVVTIAA